MTRQPLWVILCRIPEKRRTEIEEIVDEMKERDRGERKTNESEETEEIKTFPLYPYLTLRTSMARNWGVRILWVNMVF